MESIETDLHALSALTSRLASAQQADILLYRGAITPPAALDLIALCERHGKRRDVLLILSTVDGDVRAAFRIARCLQRAYRRFTLYVDDHCKDVGMLLALAADAIVMSDFGELGPLDVDSSAGAEPGQESAGRTALQALHTLRAQALDLFEDSVVRLRGRRGLQLTTRGVTERASELTIGLFSPLYSQFDLVQLGEAERNLQVARQYAAKVGRTNVQEGAIDRLVTGYPSSAVVIDRDEGRELFRRVREPTDDEAALLKYVEPILGERRNQQRFLYLDQFLAGAGALGEASGHEGGQASARTSEPDPGEDAHHRPSDQSNRVASTAAPVDGGSQTAGD